MGKAHRLRQYTDKELIADLKLADIGCIMSMIVSKLAEKGFDSVITHGFVGVKSALSELKSTYDRLRFKTNTGGLHVPSRLDGIHR
ncbi:MAG: hypothetical protein QXO80_03180 [Thermosphaera sp.]